MEVNCCSICFNEIIETSSNNGIIDGNSTFADIITPNTNQNRRFLPCNHNNQFHVGCLEKWLQRTPNCPLCRAVVNVNTPNTPPSTPSSFTNQNNYTRTTQYGSGTGPDRGFLIHRVISLLRDYSNADTMDEKEYKKSMIYRIVQRHGLIDEDRICIAMAQHNLPIHA